MTKKNLYKTQLQIIRFVKNFFLFNSPFLKKNYFAFYEDSNKILEIKSKFLNSQNYKNYLINYFNSFLQSKVIISSNKIEIKKKFKNLIITWGNKKSFSKNGEFFDKYFSYNSNMYKNTYWIVLADRKIKKKLKKNIFIIYLNDEFINKFLKIFIILLNFTLAKLKLKKIIDSDNLISDKINKFIDLNSNFKNLENIIMPYEGQAFQKKIFFHQKKKN